MIEVRGLSFSYNGSPPVIDNVDLVINKGEMVGILGPNGSGKSTLLKLISNTLSPNKGSVLLDGRPIHHFGRKNIARKMAVVPQETDLGFDFTVREIVAMGRYPHLGRFQFNDPISREVVDLSMGTTGVLELANKPISKLSGGEKQRVIIAKALAQEPDILLLDEPTKNLDIRHSLDILNLVRKMNSEMGITVIAVLHDLDLSARYCDRTILLKEGGIYKDGPTENVLVPVNIENVFHVRSRIHDGEGFRIEVLD